MDKAIRTAVEDLQELLLCRVEKVDSEYVTADELAALATGLTAIEQMRLNEQISDLLCKHEDSLAFVLEKLPELICIHVSGADGFPVKEGPK